ncbi:MAG: hypothetical protein LC659_02760 [Myxococcales bacterium]|nr:hypothetical protein [Myxococcales bacterium]
MFRLFALGIAVVAVVETPIVHLLAHAAPWWVRTLLIAVNVGTIVWLLGVRNRMRDAAHTLDDDTLAIALPGKWRGAIPLALVQSVRRIAPAPGSSAPRGTLRVTPIDAPNVELSLREAATLHGSFGIARSAPRIQLFVDEPDLFVGAISARLPPAR